MTYLEKLGVNKIEESIWNKKYEVTLKSIVTYCIISVFLGLAISLFWI